MTIGKNIRAVRKQKNMTQIELCRRCGFSQGQLSEYENDKHEPPIEYLGKIADALGVSVAVLDDRLLKRFPPTPDDDFFQIVMKNWPELTNEQRGKLATETVSLVESNRSVPSNSTSSEAEKKRA